MAQPHQQGPDVVHLPYEYGELVQRWERVLAALHAHYDTQKARTEREFCEQVANIRSSVIQENIYQSVTLGFNSLLEKFKLPAPRDEVCLDIQRRADNDQQYLHDVIDATLDDFQHAGLQLLTRSYISELAGLEERRNRDILNHRESYPVEIDGEPEWEVKRIRASRLFGANKELQYKVDWRGCVEDETSYPAGNFRNAAKTLEAFHLEHPEAAGPPMRLQIWIRDAEDDRFSETDIDDNRAET